MAALRADLLERGRSARGRDISGDRGGRSADGRTNGRNRSRMVFTGIATRRPGDLSFPSDDRALALARPEQAGVPMIDLLVAR